MLIESVCNLKQKWNNHECRWAFKELDDWNSCEKDCIWNSGACYWECNKACKIDEYLDTKQCSCEKRLIGKLVSDSEDEVL